MVMHRLLPFCCLVAFASCEDDPLWPVEVAVFYPDVRAYVTGVAGENLDDLGHFRIPEPSVEGPHPIITEKVASELALGVIRTWYANPSVRTLPGSVSLVQSAEDVHGGPIEWDALTAGPRRPYFAQSHLLPLSPGFGESAIRHFGPRFLVPLYEGSRPVVVVSVAAYATDAFIDHRGYVRNDSQDGGGEFHVSGIPADLNGITLPPSPEVVTVFAARQTGALVAEMPILGRPGNFVSSTGARWLVTLDRAVTFERLMDGELVSSREVYVGVWPSITDAQLGFLESDARLRLFVAASEQPATQMVGDNNAPLRPGYAVNLHAVRVRR